MSKPSKGDAIELAPGQAVAVEWTAEEYFADRTALTRSVLGLLPADPYAFGAWLRGVSSSRDSDAMRFGRLLHMAMLEPAVFEARVLVDVPRPEIADGRSPAGTPERIAYERWRLAVAARGEVLARDDSIVPASTKDAEMLAAIVKAARANVEARVLLNAPGRCEQTVLWREPTTGVLVKVRVDKMMRLRAVDTFGSLLAPGLVAMDLKSTVDDSPREFARSVRRLGYLPQAALYSDAVEALHGETPRWLFLVASTVPVAGDSHGVSVYDLTDEQLARGREIYRSQLNEAVERVSTDNWTAAHRRGVNPLPL